MPADQRRLRRLRDIVIDCAAPAPLARFWSYVLQWPEPVWNDADLADLRARGIVCPKDDPTVFIASGDFALPRICFQRVPDAASGKLGKNRLHLDVNVGSQDEVSDLVQRGTTILAHHDGWVVLADPEGDEFCAVWH